MGVILIDSLGYIKYTVASFAINGQASSVFAM